MASIEGTEAVELGWGLTQAPTGTYILGVFCGVFVCENDMSVTVCAMSCL
jgi:hypothetical protein